MLNPLQPVGPDYLLAFHRLTHRTWSFHDIEQNENGDFNMGTRDYADSLFVFITCGCLLSVVFLLVLLVLSFARCCCPSKKTRPLSRHIVLLFLIWASTATASAYFWMAGGAVIDASREVDAFYQPYMDSANALPTITSAMDSSLPTKLIAQLKAMGPEANNYVTDINKASQGVAEIASTAVSISSQFPNLDISSATEAVRTSAHWTTVGLTIFAGCVALVACLLPCARRPCIRWTYIVLAFIILCFASIQRGTAFGAITGLADACHDVTGQLLIVIDTYSSADANGLASYYLACNAPSPLAPLFGAAHVHGRTASSLVNETRAFLASKGASTHLADAYLADIRALNGRISQANVSLDCTSQFLHYSNAVDYMCNEAGQYAFAILILAFFIPIFVFISLVRVIIAVPSARGSHDDAYEMEESKPLLEKPYMYNAVNY